MSIAPVRVFDLIMILRNTFSWSITASSQTKRRAIRADALASYIGGFTTFMNFLHVSSADWSFVVEFTLLSVNTHKQITSIHSKIWAIFFKLSLSQRLIPSNTRYCLVTPSP